MAENKSNKKISVICSAIIVFSIFIFTILYPRTFTHAQTEYPPPLSTSEPGNPSGIHKIYMPIINRSSRYIENSYYVGSLSNFYQLGMQRGLEHASLLAPIVDLVILHFGSPYDYLDGYGNTIYGTFLFDYETNVPISSIKSAVMNYVNGYLEGSAPNPTSSLIIVVGTSTSHYYVTYGHGNAWGDMIYGSEGEEIGLRDWLTNLNVEDQVSVVGGIDIEPGDYPTWRVPSVDSLWLSGYADDLPSNNKTHLLYVFGATGGDCPTDYPYEEPRYQPEVNPATCSTVEKPNNDPPTGTTFYTWTQDNFYQLAWDYPVISIYPNIFPIPQIYTQPEYSHPNGRNAEQWYRIGLYSYLKYSSTMGFQGVITQQKACDYFRKDHNGELPPECVGAYLSKAEALQLFKNELNSDPYNRTSSLLANRKTDIGYYFGNP